MRIAARVFAGAVIVGALVLPLHARQRGAAPANPADVKSILFELANSMGMLRGLQQEDSIITLEHWAAGTGTTGQQRFEIPDYRISLNYAVPGMRVDFTTKAADGQARRTIQVLAGAAAWNETERGGNATPAPNSARERAAALWSTPMGVVKAAAAAGANAKITTTGGAMVLSFPLPAPASDVTVNATLRRDASLVTAHPSAMKNLVGTYITRVQTTGSVVMDTTYAEYGDWNWNDYRSDIMLPRRIVWTYGNQTVALTTRNTNTYNPYVIMPVPPNVK
jgi:hypothetical protein